MCSSCSIRTDIHNDCRCGSCPVLVLCMMYFDYHHLHAGFAVSSASPHSSILQLQTRPRDASHDSRSQPRTDVCPDEARLENISSRLRSRYTTMPVVYRSHHRLSSNLFPSQHAITPNASNNKPLVRRSVVKHTVRLTPCRGTFRGKPSRCIERVLGASTSS